MPLFWFVIALNFLFLPLKAWGGDVSEIQSWIISAFGFCSIIYAVIRGRIRFIHAIILLPVVYMVGRSFWGILGYTDLILAKLAGAFGVAIWASWADRKWIWRGLLVTAIIQMVLTYGPGVDWGADYGALYTWGTMRHRIRYSTILFAGLLAAWTIYHNRDETTKWSVAAIVGGLAGIVSLGHAYSNTILVLTAITMLYLIGRQYGLLWALCIASGAVIGGLFVPVEGFSLDPGRSLWWAYAGREWLSAFGNAMMGHGLGSWQLVCGVYDYPWHPHNDFLLLLYEQGIIGFGFWVVAGIVAFLFATRNQMVLIGFSAITISFGTNSGLMYPEMLMLWMLFLGMAISEELENDFEMPQVYIGDDRDSRIAGKLARLFGGSSHIFGR